MYNYQGNSTPTTLKLLPEYSPIKINVTPLNLTFVKLLMLSIKVINLLTHLSQNCLSFLSRHNQKRSHRGTCSFSVAWLKTQIYMLFSCLGCFPIQVSFAAVHAELQFSLTFIKNQVLAGLGRDN